jgi:NhaP-type Na+/H+ or K+/H+ antiporter
MRQSKRGSACEALTNIAVGYGINFLANLLVFPLFGLSISIEQNLKIGIIYTFISLVRSYLLRRIYNSIKT